MDARRALLVLRRWWPVLVIGTLLAAGVAYGVSKTLPRVYEATALVDVNPGIGTVGGGQDFNEVQASWSEANKAAQLIHTTPIAQAAIHQLHLDSRLDPGTLLKDTTAQAGSQLGTVSLTVRANDPGTARDLANAMVAIFIARDKQKNTAGLATTLAEINRAIRFYSTDNRQAQARINALGTQTSPRDNVLFQRTADDQQSLWQLQQTAIGLRLRLAGAGTSLSLAQPAIAPSAPVSPRTLVNVLVAAALALLVLLGVALLADFFDDRPRSPGDVAARLDLPLLGTIDPAPPGNAALVVLEEPAAARADEYRALRAALGRATGTGQRATGTGAATAPTPVLVVTGVRPGDGATTVAANLAAVAARAGERVILVDANLRRPGIGALFDLADGAGLAESLREGADASTLLQESSLPGLRILAAGHAPAEAIDLLGSARLRAALTALGAAGDLIVADTATAASADTAYLAALGDATLVVARLPGADGQGLDDAGRQLRLSSARLAGVAVTLHSAPARLGQTVRSQLRAQAPAPVPARAEPAGQTGLRGANK